MYVCILRYQVRLSVYLNEVIKTIKETVGSMPTFWEKVIYCHKRRPQPQKEYTSIGESEIIKSGALVPEATADMRAPF